MSFGRRCEEGVRGEDAWRGDAWWTVGGGGAWTGMAGGW